MPSRGAPAAGPDKTPTAGGPAAEAAASNAPRRAGSKKRMAEVRARAVCGPRVELTGQHAQVCPVCFAFATEDAAELNAHSEACFTLAAQREAGAAPAAEAHFRRFLAHRALPLIQSCAVLMTLNSLGTAVRMTLALSSPRWARNSSVLGYLPMLHSVSRDGPAPIIALRVSEDVARRICHIVLPFFGLLRLPLMIALFVCSTSPSWREWCAQLGALRPHSRRVRERRPTLQLSARLSATAATRRGARASASEASGHSGPLGAAAGKMLVASVPPLSVSRACASRSCRC